MKPANGHGARERLPGYWLTWLLPGAIPSSAAIESAPWHDLVEASQSHHVAAVLYARLAEGGAVATLPAEARDALLGCYQRAGLDAMLWQRALRMVLPALAGEDIEAVPYKGAALAHLVYDDPALRSMSDIDLWIRADDMPRACAVLERLGYERRESADRPTALQATFDGEIAYSGRRIGVPLVELHWGVFPGEWLRRVTRIDRAGLMGRLQPRHLLGMPVRALCAEDHLIQVAVHAGITHVYSTAAVRSLLDLAMLAHRGLDWSQVVDAHESGASPAQSDMHWH